jgi:hypothetical protein
LLCRFLQLPITSSLFSPNVLLSTLFSNTLSPCSPSILETEIYTHTQPYAKVMYILILLFLAADKMMGGSELNSNMHYQNSIISLISS